MRNIVLDTNYLTLFQPTPTTTNLYIAPSLQTPTISLTTTNISTCWNQYHSRQSNKKFFKMAFATRKQIKNFFNGVCYRVIQNFLTNLTLSSFRLHTFLLYLETYSSGFKTGNFAISPFLKSLILAVTKKLQFACKHLRYRQKPHL